MNPAMLTERPPAPAYEEAKRFAPVRSGHPADLLESLALHYPTPVVAKMPVRCLTEAGRTGAFPALSSEERRVPGDHPVHALVLVGYDKGDQTFLARNCWGDRWGDRGYCRIPFDVLYALAPAGSNACWFIAKADTGTSDHVGPVGLGAMDGSSAAPPAAETLASMAARLRSEIRSDLQRDLADATKRIRERVAPPAAPPGQVGARACTSCQGTKTCWACGGTGCPSCGRTGRCSACG
jgi:hypothetical protein